MSERDAVGNEGCSQLSFSGNPADAIVGLRDEAIIPGDRSPDNGMGPWTKAAFAVWAAAFLILTIRLFHLAHRVTTFSCFIAAGRAWRHGEPIYTNHSGMGFVYSPLWAAYFAIYSYFPMRIGEIVWLLSNIILLLAGTYAVMRDGVYRIASDRGRALVLILLLPLSLASLDVAQSNSALIGLLLIATAMAMQERWTLCVIAICIASYLKIYPLVLGLVLCLYQPRKVTFRLALGLLLFGVVSLILQNPHYVLAQYREWIVTRGADDRRLNSAAHAPLDLWFLLVRLWHLPVSERAYSVLQILTGSGIAGFCLCSKRWPAGRRLAGIFLLCSGWMVLLGPATEGYTYAILAPAISLGCISAFQGRTAASPQWLVGSSTALLLSAQIRSSFFASWHNIPFDGARPTAALLFVGFAIFWLREDARLPNEAPACPDAGRSFGRVLDHVTDGPGVRRPEEETGTTG